MSKKAKFRVVDGLLIAMMVVPFIFGILLKILYSPASEGVSITGALVYFSIPMPFQELLITESQVNSWIVILFILGLCLFLTHGIKCVPNSKRQHIAEFLVEKCDGLVSENMGEKFMGYAPFVGGMMALSVCSSLSSLLGLYPPTSDMNVVAGWAILVFILITYYKMKGGFGKYLKGFTEPIVVFTPLNIISEVATPVSMAFRHFGNVLSGSVISTLVAVALQAVSKMLLGWLPGVLGEIPLFRIGIPGVLSLYFDIFSGCIQAFIFAMLTMLYISGGYSEEDYALRMQKKLAKKQKKALKSAKAA